MNLERICKEAVMTKPVYCSDIYPEGLKKTIENFRMVNDPGEI
jgi:hypothetical protein